MSLLRFHSMNATSVYRLRNVKNAKVYIGISADPVRRVRRHVEMSRSRKPRTLIAKAIAKHGIDAFVLDVLSSHNTKRDAAAEEIRQVAAHGAFGAGGYNMTPGGDTPPRTTRESARKATETRTRLGVQMTAAMGPKSPTMKAHLAETSRAHFERHPEHVQKLADLRRGQNLSAEWKANLSKGQRRFWDTNPEAREAAAARGLGRTHTDETKAKMRRKKSPETRAKISASQTGRKHPHKGRVQSAETRAKISMARRRSAKERDVA
jgi:group I intron endonuclease